MNPAILSTRLDSLFPPGAVAAELRGAGDPALLLPAEAMHVARAVPKRVQEFAAGRLCARRALAEVGIVDFAIKMADDREPVWPQSFVGSITHTAGFAAAAVAERWRAAALGLDSEVVGDVDAKLWPSICVPVETAWITSLPASEQAAAVALIFSAKEAFYKCQYALVRERLNFLDVRVEVAAWGASSGMYQIHPIRHIALRTRTALPLEGRFMFHEELVTTGLALAGTAGTGAPATDPTQ